MEIQLQQVAKQGVRFRSWRLPSHVMRVEAGIKKMQERQAHSGHQQGDNRDLDDWEPSNAPSWGTLNAPLRLLQWVWLIKPVSHSVWITFYFPHLTWFSLLQPPIHPPRIMQKLHKPVLLLARDKALYLQYESTGSVGSRLVSMEMFS